MSGPPAFAGVPLKYISLVTLTVQNSALTVLLHYSRNASSYSPAVAVLLNEILKGSISFGVALYNSYQANPSGNASSQPTTKLKGRDSIPSLANGHPSGTDSSSDEWRLKGLDLGMRLRKLRREILSPDCWKLSIPAILYVIQNNLQFVAASNLDVATFQVSYQMKILTTALFSVLLLKRRLTTTKWLSLLALAVGVGIVQIQSKQAAGGSSSTPSASGHQADPTKGFIAVAMACMTSGLAGVYFEMVLKGSTADLWIRNIQLSLFSLVPALFATLQPASWFTSSNTAALEQAKPLAGGSNLNAREALTALSSAMLNQVTSSSGGIFAGFGFWAWATVLTQVIGGLVTALVIKFSDNIMKGFATSLSIVLSFLAGMVLFDFQLTTSFVIGTSIVLAATYAYNQPTPAQRSSVTNTPHKAAYYVDVKNTPVTQHSKTFQSPEGVGTSQSVHLHFDSSEPTPRRQHDASTPPDGSPVRQMGANLPPSAWSHQQQSHLANLLADSPAGLRSASRSPVGRSSVDGGSISRNRSSDGLHKHSASDATSSSLSLPGSEHNSSIGMQRSPSGGWAAALIGEQPDLVNEAERGTSPVAATFARS